MEVPIWVAESLLAGALGLVALCARNLTAELKALREAHAQLASAFAAGSAATNTTLQHIDGELERHSELLQRHSEMVADIGARAEAHRRGQA